MERLQRRGEDSLHTDAARVAASNSVHGTYGSDLDRYRRLTGEIEVQVCRKLRADALEEHVHEPLLVDG